METSIVLLPTIFLLYLSARRATGSKRCANGRLRAFYDLRAPTYREGLALIRDAAG